jgi:hypothetical protein
MFVDMRIFMRARSVRSGISDDVPLGRRPEGVAPPERGIFFPSLQTCRSYRSEESDGCMSLLTCDFGIRRGLR